MTNNIPKMDSKSTCNDLEPEGGAHVRHIHTKMPLSWIISPRSFYILTFEQELEDGSILFIETTQGVNRRTVANKEMTGNDVLGVLIVDYCKITQLKEGVLI